MERVSKHEKSLNIGVAEDHRILIEVWAGRSMWSLKVTHFAFFFFYLLSGYDPFCFTIRLKSESRGGKVKGDVKRKVMIDRYAVCLT